MGTSSTTSDAEIARDPRSPCGWRRGGLVCFVAPPRRCAEASPSSSLRASEATALATNVTVIMNRGTKLPARTARRDRTSGGLRAHTIPVGNGDEHKIEKLLQAGQSLVESLAKESMIDQRGVGGVIMMQLLPFADTKVLAVYAAFERGVYQMMGPGSSK